MSRIHYFGDGYLLEAAGPNRQSTWVCMFNPTKRDANLKFTFYYPDAEPTTMPYQVPAETGTSVHLLTCKEILQDKRFGAKIETSEPMVLQITTGYYGVDDRHDWYTRAMHSVICGDRLSTINYYADALVIDREGQRLKEPEWAFLLNPNKATAHVTLYANYGNGQKATYHFQVAPERLLPIFMDELVVKNQIFGAKYISDIPIAIQQTRLIVEEDRQTIRACFSVMAKPEPLTWQDESELTGL
jgi:hypothetical protein